jgi:hypothetical protein
MNLRCRFLNELPKNPTFNHGMKRLREMTDMVISSYFYGLKLIDV